MDFSFVSSVRMENGMTAMSIERHIQRLHAMLKHRLHIVNVTKRSDAQDNPHRNEKIIKHSRMVWTN